MSKYCPKCGGDSYIVDSRDKPYGVRRRRMCENCGYKWSTIEVMAGWKPLIISNNWSDEQIRVFVKRVVRKKGDAI